MEKNCTVYKTMDFVGKKWTILVLLELYKGEQKWKRYSHIKKKMQDITPKILSARLKELEQEGMIKKRVDARKFPIKCEYSLSKSGDDFVNIVGNIKKWSLKWKIKNKQCDSKLCKYCKL
jgi:DNA-binding HxlR family transcriptional regulator|tara:strand:+ start:142 stop:501 length:360 start_codon:yes stop_codon:yes gene_type:complete